MEATQIATLQPQFGSYSQGRAMEDHGVRWNTTEYNRIQWNTNGIQMEENGIQWNTMEYHNMEWNTMEYNGIQME